jgi:hypothetical protein
MLSRQRFAVVCFLLLVNAIVCILLLVNAIVLSNFASVVWGQRCLWLVCFVL